MGKSVKDMCKNSISKSKNKASKFINKAKDKAKNIFRRKKNRGGRDVNDEEEDTCRTEFCTPVIKTNNVYVPLPAPKCSDTRYSSILQNPQAFTALLTPDGSAFTDPTMLTINNPTNPLAIDLDFLRDCIKGIKYDSKLNDLTQQGEQVNLKVNEYTSQKGLIDTYNEMNNSSLYYYKSDLIYVICKISFFIILIITYVYFFKLTGIIEPFKNLFNTIATKGDAIINKISDKIKKPTNGIAKPTNGIAKPTNGIAKPTNSVPKPTNGIPKPTNGMPKPTNAVPKPTNGIPKPTNGVPKPTNGIPKPGIIKSKITNSK
jgi:hypothetical protein